MEAKQYILNKQNMTEDIKKEIKTYIETNENENTTTQNLCDSVKAVLIGRFIALQTYFQKTRETSNKQPNFTPKGTSLDRKHKKKRPKKQTQNNKVNSNRIIHINNYLTCKWAKCSSQRTTDWLNGYKNKTTIYAIYKRPTSDQIESDVLEKHIA